MAQGEMRELLSRILMAAWSGDAAAQRAWQALIDLLLWHDSTTVHRLLVTPRLLIAWIEEHCGEDPQFARAIQKWLSQYGTVAGGSVIPKVHSDDIDPVGDPITSEPELSDPVRPPDSHAERHTPDAVSARPPGPPFGDDDWDDETDDNAGPRG